MPVGKYAKDIGDLRGMRDWLSEQAKDLENSRYRKVRQLAFTAIKASELIDHIVKHQGLQLYELRNFPVNGMICSIGSYEELIERHGQTLDYREGGTE